MKCLQTTHNYFPYAIWLVCSKCGDKVRLAEETPFVIRRDVPVEDITWRQNNTAREKTMGEYDAEILAGQEAQEEAEEALSRVWNMNPERVPADNPLRDDLGDSNIQ